MNRSHNPALSALLLVLLLTSLACALPGAGAQQAAPGLEETRIALSVEQTSLANEKAARQTEEAVPPTAAPSATLPPASPTPLPATDTPAPAQPSATVAPQASATPEPSATAVDIQARIKGANVLVFEDMMSYYRQKPVVHQAVDEMNFSGGKVIEVGDALGRFKEMLINTVNWDLIIVAAEYRTAVQGEFWQYVYDQVDRGAAVIIEVWYMDKHYTDIQPLLNKCGLEFQKNWVRGPKYRLEDYAVYWLQPEHAFFQAPQDPVSLGNPNYLYWVPPLSDDAGDLLRLGTSGDAVLLAGTQPGMKTSYGVLGACLNGTMVVQTFSSHDYKPGEVDKLWKNSMRYVLTNHFLQAK